MRDFARKLFALLRGLKAVRKDYVVVAGMTRRQFLRCIGAVTAVGLLTAEEAGETLRCTFDGALFDADVIDLNGNVMTLEALQRAIEEAVMSRYEPEALLMSRRDYEMLNQALNPGRPQKKIASVFGMDIVPSLFVPEGKPKVI